MVKSGRTAVPHPDGFQLDMSESYLQLKNIVFLKENKTKIGFNLKHDIFVLKNIFVQKFGNWRQKKFKFFLIYKNYKFGWFLEHNLPKYMFPSFKFISTHQ